ncbi:MAG: NAD(P)/FAD-dependent oxidoreductase [Planctomycetota bacterium]
MTSENSSTHIYDVIVVGGGAAGVGIGVALQHADVENFLVLDRHMVGASFAMWPAETRFISPSFATNAIGMLDLNSVAIGVSPAYSLGVEHPTGEEFAKHLVSVADYFELPVREDTEVLEITRTDDHFVVRTNEGRLLAKHVVWAAGEFQYPVEGVIDGSEHCRHTATVERYGDLDGDEFLVIGGYESGIDAAYHLALQGKRVTVLDSECPWDDESSDPSIALSTYSLERMRDPLFKKHVELFANTPVAAVAAEGDAFAVTSEEGRRFETGRPPLLAAGFAGSHRLVDDLFEQRSDGFPLLNKDDESTITPGLFLCGPSVRHGNNVFCFIYKFRQRFAVVAKKIATSLGLEAEYLESYRDWGMYLDDLSICGEDCVC